MKARLLVLDVIDNEGFREIECDDLQDYYDALKCDCFDITHRNVGGRAFDIFCDDVGLFVENPKPSAFDNNGQPALIGNLIFANHDVEGNTTSLTDEDIEHIKSCCVVAIIDDAKNPTSMWHAVYPVS